MRDVGLDQHSGFSLADERRGCCDDGFGSRDLHSVEEDCGELADGPLQPAPVVEELNEGDEEDDRGNDAEEEVVELEEVGTQEESSSFGSEAEERGGEEGDKVEDIITSLCAENEKGEDVLCEHAYNDGLPFDRLAVVGSSPETEDEDYETEQADSAVCSGVVGRLVACKSSNQEHGNGSCSSEWQSQLLWDHVNRAVDGLHPYPGNWLSDIFGRDVEGNQADGECGPEEERNEP